MKMSNTQTGKIGRESRIQKSDATAEVPVLQDLINNYLTTAKSDYENE